MAVHFGPLHAQNGRGDEPIVSSEIPIVFIFGQLGTVVETAAYEQKIDSAVRSVFSAVGYDHANCFDPRDVHVFKSFNRQSEEIIAGIERQNHSHGAGDATIVNGYASSQTKEHLSASHALALNAVHLLDESFIKGTVPGIAPDGKVQVEVEFESCKNTFPIRPRRAREIIIAAQHKAGVSLDSFRKNIASLVRSLNGSVLSTDGERLNLIDSKTIIVVNGAGEFSVGGPISDSGANGRMDSLYVSGATRRYGGGLLIGRDVTKPDFSCQLIARNIALHLVESIAKEAEVSITYWIGATKPASVSVVAQGCKYDGKQLAYAIEKVFDLTPDGIKDSLNLSPKNFSVMAKYGLFGVLPQGSLGWEKIDEQKLKILEKHLKRGATVAVQAKIGRHLQYIRK